MTHLRECPSCDGEARMGSTSGHIVCGDAECYLVGPIHDNNGAKWNALPHRSDVVAARIEGMREALAIVLEDSHIGDDGFRVNGDLALAEAAIDARIAKLGKGTP